MEKCLYKDVYQNFNFAFSKEKKMKKYKKCTLWNGKKSRKNIQFFECVKKK